MAHWSINEAAYNKGREQGERDAKSGLLFFDRRDLEGDDYADGYRAGWYDVEGRVPKEEFWRIPQ